MPFKNYFYYASIILLLIIFTMTMFIFFHRQFSTIKYKRISLNSEEMNQSLQKYEKIHESQIS